MRYTTAELIQLIRAAARRYGIDESLAVAQLRHESVNFAPRFVYGPGVSPAGAQGLAQFMPGTWRQYGQGSPFDPAQAVEAWGKYMSYLLRLFGGDYRLALAGYNAGEGAVLKYGRKVPPYAETQKYVREIMNAAGSVSFSGASAGAGVGASIDLGGELSGGELSGGTALAILAAVIILAAATW